MFFKRNYFYMIKHQLDQFFENFELPKRQGHKASAQLATPLQPQQRLPQPHIQLHGAPLTLDESICLPMGYQIRLLTPSDAPLLFYHFMSLDKDDLSLRFFRHVSPYYLNQLVNQMSFEDPRIIGIFHQDLLVATAEWAPCEYQHEQGIAELAFSTLRAHRGKKLAQILAYVAADDAYKLGFKYFQIDMLPHNHGAKQLVKSLSFESIDSQQDDGVYSCRLPLGDILHKFNYECPEWKMG